MNIKFRELQQINGESKGKQWTAHKIIGLKMEDGSPWESSNIFANQYNADLLAQLEELERGEIINVIHKKNDAGYWQVQGIGPATEDNKPAPPRGNMRGKGTKSGTGKGGDSMSKEEWAAKNEVDRVRIAKSVALKAAVELAKAGTKAETVVAMAQEFMPFLTDDKIEGAFDGGEDGLDPQDIAH